MKKLMMVTAVVASMASFAKTTITVGTNEVEAIEFANSYKTNSYVSTNNKIWSEVEPSIIAQCDRILAEKNCYSYFGSYSMFPALTTNYVENILKVKMPEAYDYAKSELLKTNVTRDMKYTMFNVSSGLIGNHCIEDRHRKVIIQRAPGFAKKALRKQGKSFVDKDGVSPVKTYVDAVANALNAKRIEGLDNALKAIGMDYGFKFEDYLMTQNEIDQLKEKIMIGDIPFTGKNQNILRTHLGVEEYNKFVKVYNEGE